MEKLTHVFVVIWTALFTIFTSHFFWTVFCSWLVASLIKVLIYLVQKRRFNFMLLIDTGHMPSSHSAFVAALATVIGLESGWSSPMFMLALGFAILVMNDAAGVRRAAGHQAKILNHILDDMYEKKPFKPERLTEFLGHTRLEVMAGALVGIFTSLLLYT